MKNEYIVTNNIHCSAKHSIYCVAESYFLTNKFHLVDRTIKIKFYALISSKIRKQLITLGSYIFSDAGLCLK